MGAEAQSTFLRALESRAFDGELFQESCCTKPRDTRGSTNPMLPKQTPRSVRMASIAQTA